MGQILMAFYRVFIYRAQIGRFRWHFAPFSPMGVIKADFDGISPRFDLWGPYRQIFFGICPLFTAGAHLGLFWWYFPPFDLWGPLMQILMAFSLLFPFWCPFWWYFPLLIQGAHLSKGPKGRDYILVYLNSLAIMFQIFPLDPFFFVI